MVTRAQAAERAAAHVAARLHTDMQITEDWPDGAYRSSDEPVWAIWLAPEVPRVGASGCVIFSQATGRVIADSLFGARWNHVIDTTSALLFLMVIVRCFGTTLPPTTANTLLSVESVNLLS